RHRPRGRRHVVRTAGEMDRLSITTAMQDHSTPRVPFRTEKRARRETYYPGREDPHKVARTRRVRSAKVARTRRVRCAAHTACAVWGARRTGRVRATLSRRAHGVCGLLSCLPA